MALDVSPEVEAAVLERVRSGDYQSAEDVLRAAVHILEWAERHPEVKRALLRDGFRATGVDGGEARGQENSAPTGIDRARAELLEGPGLPREEFFDRMNARLIAERVMSGKYQSAGDVVYSALLALEQTEASDTANESLRRELDLAIAELDRGEGIPGDEAFAQIQEELRRITGR